MSDIFISYSTKDRDRVKVLAEALRRQGWSVWWDRNVPFGKPFDQVIKEALREARCVVIAWSNNSIESDWVIEEAQYGRQRGILVPVLLDDPHDDLPPFGFRRIQGAELQNWSGNDKHPVFQKLVSDITSILSPDPVSPELNEEDQLPTLGEQPTEPVRQAPQESSMSASDTLDSIPVPPKSKKQNQSSTLDHQPVQEPVKQNPHQITLESVDVGSFTISEKFIGLVTIGWAIGFAIGGAIGFAIREAIGWAIGVAISVAIIGTIGGLFTAYAVKQVKPSIRAKQMVIIVVGWIIGWAIGFAIGFAIGGAISVAVSGAVSGAISGAIGGGIMLWILHPTLNKDQKMG